MNEWTAFAALLSLNVKTIGFRQTEMTTLLTSVLRENVTILVVMFRE